MSYVETTQTYWNPGPVAYPDEPYAPVPGWGMRPNMAGPRRIGVGGLGSAPGPDDTVVWLGPSPFPPVAWLLSENVSLGALRAFYDGGGLAFHYSELAKLYGALGSQSAIDGMYRVFLDGWARLEGQHAAQGKLAEAAAYAYAQAILWRSFPEGNETFPNAMTESETAASRAVNQRKQAFAKLGHVYSLAPAVATIQGKPKAAWSVATKPQQAAPSPAQQRPGRFSPPPRDAAPAEGLRYEGLYYALAVAGVAAVGGAAWWWSKRS